MSNILIASCEASNGSTTDSAIDLNNCLGITTVNSFAQVTSSAPPVVL